MRWVRWAVFLAVASGFFALALSADVYNLTSPPALSWHIVLRKTYSVIAFALVGLSFTWASRFPPGVVAAAVALYSGMIEIGQNVPTVRESWVWNAVDVGCGALGGWLGALIPGVRAR